MRGWSWEWIQLSLRVRFMGDRDGVEVKVEHEVRFEKKMGSEMDWS